MWSPEIGLSLLSLAPSREVPGGAAPACEIEVVFVFRSEHQETLPKRKRPLGASFAATRAISLFYEFRKLAPGSPAGTHLMGGEASTRAVNSHLVVAQGTCRAMLTFALAWLEPRKRSGVAVFSAPRLSPPRGLGVEDVPRTRHRILVDRTPLTN